VARTLFCHATLAIQAEGFRTLKEGQRVEFEVKKGPKGSPAPRRPAARGLSLEPFGAEVLSRRPGLRVPPVPPARTSGRFHWSSIRARRSGRRRRRAATSSGRKDEKKEQRKREKGEPRPARRWRPGEAPDIAGIGARAAAPPLEG